MPKPTHGIAVVDDEPGVRVTLRHIINSIDGFHCCGEYASGEAALSGIPASETRAVFMDLKMPGMSGLDCTRRLLALMPELRVIIATAWADPDILLACYRAGALHHLIKPFSLDSCRAAVRLYCDIDTGHTCKSLTTSTTHSLMNGSPANDRNPRVVGRRREAHTRTDDLRERLIVNSSELGIDN